MADTTTSTNCPTLCELSDIISAMQRQINDLSVILSGHTERIEGNEENIITLQYPPTGPPQQTLDWFALGHTTREVDTILDTDLTTLSSASGSNEESIAQVAANLEQEISDRTTADTDLQGVDTDLQVQITDNLGTLTQEVADRSALSETVSTQYDAINVRIDSVQDDMSAQASAGDAAASSASSQIATMNAALQVQQTQILQLQGIGVDPAGAQASQITSLTIIANDAAAATALETTNRKNADIALQASINALNSSIFGIQSGLDSEVSTRIAADAALSTEIGALEASMSGFSGSVAAETAARTAADETLATDIDTNTDNISANSVAIASEVTARTDADTEIQGQVDTHATSIDANTTQIATNTTDITQVKGQFSVVKDAGGYVTDWQAIDQLSAPGDFHLKDLNNNARLTAPGYPTKYFPPVSVALFSPANAFDADYNGSTANDFHGIDGNDYTRPVKVANTLTVALNGSVFLGVDASTGGNLNRLGQSLTTFKVDFSGYVNKNLSLWYRIKNTSSDNTQRWFPAAWAGVSIPSPRTYEYTRGQAVVQITVPTDKVIEFGLTVLHTQNASINDANYDLIYDGSVSVMALNMMTVS